MIFENNVPQSAIFGIGGWVYEWIFDLTPSFTIAPGANSTVIGGGFANPVQQPLVGGISACRRCVGVMFSL
jgi:hypothetical protein